MRSSAISRGLCLALLATAAHAQTVAAGARAVVNSDTLQVYTSMSLTSVVKATLTRGDAVTIGLVLFGDDITWCAVSKEENRRLGYVSCEFLEQERPAPPPAPASAPAPPPEKPRPQPKAFTIREVPQAPPAAIALPEPPPIPAGSAPAPTASLPAEKPKLAPKAFTVRDVPQAPPTAIALPEPPPAPAASAAATTPTLPAPAPESAPGIGADFVETALDASGLRPSLLNYTQDTHLTAFLDKGRLAEIDVPALDRVLTEQFKATAFYAAIGAQFRKSYAPEVLPPVVEWLRSPLTGKLADMERLALKPESRDALVAFAGSLSKSAPEESRLLLIHRLYDSQRACDMEVETTISLVQTVALAIGPALPKEKRYTEAALKEALAPVKTRYGSIMKNARLVRYLFAYQGATDAELEQQVNFLESDAGKWFISVVERGFSDAKEAISGALSAEIARKVKPKRR